jgi:hypothetical protein
MKVILKFDGVEEQEMFTDALNGWKWRVVCREMNELLKRYDDYKLSEETCSKIRERLYESINDRNLEL